MLRRLISLGTIASLVLSGYALAPVAMTEVVRQVKANLLRQIESKGATIREQDLSTLSGDGPLLVQLLQNLVSNAIRYCTEAPPVIEVSMAEVEDGTELRVADNGPGIPAAYRDEIFKPFKRLVGREVEGSGLGLSICRRIAELHGATIRCAEAPGGGSVTSVQCDRRDRSGDECHRSPPPLSATDRALEPAGPGSSDPPWNSGRPPP